MKKFFIPIIFCLLGVGQAMADSAIDQQQIEYDGGLSARVISGYEVGQSFVAGVSGTMTEIEMGFFNQINGTGTLRVLTGTGTSGTVLQSELVSVSSTSSRVNWNAWQVNVPVTSGSAYTFAFTPTSGNMPDPYGVCLGNISSYSHGSLLDIESTGIDSGNFQTVFRTHVVGIPGTTLFVGNAKTLDQVQTGYSGGLSARNLPGYEIYQTFTAGITGTMVEVDMGFFNQISASGTLAVLEGSGTGGAVLESETVSVSSTSSAVNWNEWPVNIPLISGSIYSLLFTPAGDMPDPYGVCIGPSNSYSGGELYVVDPSGVSTATSQSVFRTFVAVAGSSPAPTLGNGGTLDQEQLVQGFGFSPSMVSGTGFGQDFKVGVTGTMTEIDLGFYDEFSGSGTLNIYSGSAETGALLQTKTVSVGATGSNPNLNEWQVNVPVASGSNYTFIFFPDWQTMPNPFGISLGADSTYSGGAFVIDSDNSARTQDFQTTFRIYVASSSTPPTPPVPPPPTMGETYLGLLTEMTGVEKISGKMSVTIGKINRFSAVLDLHRKTYSFSGLFDSNGNYNGSIANGAIGVSLTPVSNAQISGTVTTATQAFSYNAGKEGNGITPSGKFQFGITPGLVLGTQNPVPQGSGYGHVVWSNNAGVSLTGKLPDGTWLEIRSVMTSGSTLPIYAPIGLTGSSAIQGILTFSDIPNVSDASGTLFLQDKSHPFPAGFTMSGSMIAAKFTDPITGLGDDVAAITVSGPSLGTSFSDAVALTTKSYGATGKANGTLLTINQTNDTFSGAFINPANNKSVPFSGVLLPKSRTGAGMFGSGTSAGTVTIQY